MTARDTGGAAGPARITPGLAREAGQGTLREAITRSSGGYVAIYAIGTTAVLVLLGDEGLDITRLHRESRSVVDTIEKLLAWPAPQPKSPDPGL
jgi:predicted regulator of Ras-like GTPase activity (Roadblock/LC7/MglB family)